MKKALVALAFSSLALVGLVLAQGDPFESGGSNSANRSNFQKYTPWFNLGGTIRIMTDVDKEPKLAFTKAQAKLALPILKDLGTRAALKPEDATKINTMLEDKVVSAAQLKWMDQKRLALAEERRKRMAQQGAQGTQGTAVRLPGAGDIGDQRGGQGGPGGGNRAMFDAIQNNKPFNPFKDGRNADDLKALVDLLSKK